MTKITKNIKWLLYVHDLYLKVHVMTINDKIIWCCFNSIWVSYLFRELLSSFSSHKLGCRNCRKEQRTLLHEGESHSCRLQENHTQWTVGNMRGWRRLQTEPTALLLDTSRKFWFYVCKDSRSFVTSSTKDIFELWDRSCWWSSRNTWTHEHPCSRILRMMYVHHQPI